MKKALLSLTALSATALSVSAQTTLFDFNTPNQLNLSSQTAPTQSATGGLGNSGAILGASGLDAQFTAITPGAYQTDTSSAFTLTQSVFVQTTATLGGITDQPAVILGLSESPTQTVPAIPNQDLLSTLTANHFSAGLTVTNPDNGSGGVVFGLRGLGQGENGLQQVLPPFSFTVAADSWFFFEVDYAFTPTNIVMTYRVNEYDDSTDTIGSSLLDVTLAAGSRPTSFTENAELYGFLASDTQLDSSIAAFDNATLVGVPEPSAYALIAGSLALGWIMVRRRS